MFYKKKFKNINSKIENLQDSINKLLSYFSKNIKISENNNSIFSLNKTIKKGIINSISHIWGKIMKDKGYWSTENYCTTVHFTDVCPPELKDEHVKNSRIYVNRIDTLHAIPKGGIMVEVGTMLGEYAKYIHQICQPKELHIIDLEFRSDFLYSYFNEYIENGTVILHKGDSSQILKNKFPDKYFDFIYIDGDHSYTGANNDLLAAITKIKDDGIIGLNDYCIMDIFTLEKFGVQRAIHEVCLNHNFQIVGLALNTYGFKDVLLKKI